MLHLKNSFSERLAAVSELVERTNKSSVLIIQQFCSASETITKFPKVRESISNILAFVELGDAEVLRETIAMADGIFDNIVFDADIKLPISNQFLQIVRNNIKKTKLFFYSDINTWADSAVQFILQTEKGLWGKHIMVAGEGLLHDALVQRIKLFDIDLVTNNSDAIDVLIGSKLKSISANETITERLNKNASLYDIGIGNFSASLIKAAVAREYDVYRIDVRAGISSLIINILETDYLINRIMGRTKIKNIELVAGGIMGGKNAIILDDINYPSNIIGVADGKGYVKLEPHEKDNENLAFVERLIKKV